MAQPGILIQLLHFLERQVLLEVNDMFSSKMDILCKRNLKLLSLGTTKEKINRKSESNYYINHEKKL